MLDPRLFDLLKTLAAADLDWLADEVVRGILAGEVQLETEDSVAAARSGVFRARQDGAGLKASDGQAQEALPIEGEAQLDWAIRHVSIRLRDALAMMRASADRLDRLVDAAGSDGGARLQGKVGRTQLVLSSGENVLDEAGPKELSAAQQAVAELKRALEQWRDTWTGGGGA